MTDANINYSKLSNAQGQGRVLYIIGNISPTIEGLHITGGYFSEARMLNAAHQYQKATDWHAGRPAGIEP